MAAGHVEKPKHAPENGAWRFGAAAGGDADAPAPAAAEGGGEGRPGLKLREHMVDGFEGHAHMSAAAAAG